MSPQDWEALEARLSGAYGFADLLVDGYEITLQVQRAKALRYEIVVFVNGKYTGAMLLNDCEERRRFFRPVRTCYMSRELYEIYRKGFGKKRADAERARAKGCYYMPSWLSARALIRHLKKNNTSITLKETA